MSLQLQQGFQVVAFKLQEAAAMLHSDTRKRLSDEISDQHRKNNDYGGYVDHTGDGQSGDVVYSCNGDLRKASYELGSVGGKATAHIDMDDSTNVVPVTNYQEEADDNDQYAAMQEALVKTSFYTELPLYERFISKGERDKADEGSFAGKGKSFPILKPSDVSAAVRAMGRAGSSNYGMAQLKANIIRIAKAKGWTNELPKAWRDGAETKESASVSRETGSMKLVESIGFPVDLELREAFTVGSKIKLIAPGAGSTAYYTKESLQQAARDKIFHAGLPMRIDHPTKAEEAARPEGSVKDWGAVLARDAEYLESYVGKNGKDMGPGLYSEIKPFSDHAQTIQEKGPYAGVSIRAEGNAYMEAGKPVIREGCIVLAKFTSAEGADMVTRAGAGGMFLSESARVATNSQEVEMTEQQVQALVESAVEKAVAKVTSPVQSLTERALKGDAFVMASKLLAPLSLNEAAKHMVIENVIERGIPQKDGVLDETKLTEAVTAEAKRVGAVVGQMTGSGRIFNMGETSSAPIADPKEEKRLRKLQEAQAADDIAVFASLGLSESAAKHAAMGRVA